MTIYFVAGEVSADNHGAALMRSLRASLEAKITSEKRASVAPRPVAGLIRPPVSNGVALTGEATGDGNHPTFVGQPFPSADEKM